jgi:serine/threonine protein phosphatase 1
MRSGKFELSYKLPPNTTGRQLVIPDIHACPKTFKKLVKKIGLTKNDHLFLLGDYINKGFDSAGVIDYILELMERGFQILPLRGNHEEMLLQSHREVIKKGVGVLHVSSSSKLAQLRGAEGKILPKYLTFFQNLPYYYELDKFYLVHAGFNTESKFPFRDYETMLWTKEFEGNLEKTNGKMVIVGHTPEYIQFIYRDLDINKALIRLDNGCVYKNKWFLGKLLCLDLNSWELKFQENVD